jgi:hypothetical protein
VSRGEPWVEESRGRRRHGRGAETRDRSASQLVVGCLLMLLGSVMTLERLHLIGEVRLDQFWPVLLIAGGASKTLQRSDANGRFWGGFWMLLGACLLANSLGLARVSIFSVVGPLLLILFGLAVMTRTFGGDAAPIDAGAPGTPMVPPPLPGTGAGDHVQLFAFMSSTSRASYDAGFRGGEMTAILGQGRLDLRRASPPPGQPAVIEIVAFMGGQEIWVPQGWIVTSDVVLLLGSVEDRRVPPLESLPADAPRLMLRGFAMMGGVVIRN